MQLAAPAADTIGSPWLWGISIAVLLALLVTDFVVTHRPHKVTLREAIGWTVFYLALPVAFGGLLWLLYGGPEALEFITGFVVEKSLSVDNLFVFMLLLAAFAVPDALQQRVLLYGIVGALLLRGVFIAAGAALLQAGTWAFLVFGALLFLTALRILREAASGGGFDKEVSELRSVRLLRRVFPVTDEYHGTKLLTRVDGKRALTPLMVVVVAIFAADVVFAVDSIPAVYGITGDPYLVFATNAFALLGLRALYFVLHKALSQLTHLNHGLAVILAFIGVKLVLHWAHGIWPAVPEIPTLLSLAVIVVVLGTVTATSVWSNRRAARGRG
ncbi:TerC/Alx family metal homeostasis membrane protein [Saccharopolyspora cebuensis]|uniref:TerC/Alx family metal homeostasis membrane protein n=1 Tax=Saccharopolyspora cebuensis TaxID=418759 RepID=A0ABV4CIM3_9PSEU